MPTMAEYPVVKVDFNFASLSESALTFWLYVSDTAEGPKPEGWVPGFWSYLHRFLQMEKGRRELLASGQDAPAPGSLGYTLIQGCEPAVIDILYQLNLVELDLWRISLKASPADAADARDKMRLSIALRVALQGAFQAGPIPPELALPEGPVSTGRPN